MQGPVNIFPSLRTIRDANIEGLKHDPEIKFVLSDLELERGETDEGDASTDVGAAALKAYEPRSGACYARLPCYEQNECT